MEIHPEAAVMHTFPKCAIHYMEAITAPFSLNQPACIPDLYALPSKKVKVIQKYNFSTGINGVGFFATVSQCKSSTCVAGIYTNATNTLTNTMTIPPSTPGAEYSLVDLPKLPYQTGDFQESTLGSNSQPGVQGRVVGTSLRVRYVGPRMAESGQLVALRHPDNITLANRLFSDLKSYETASVYPVTKDTWTYVNYRPVKPQEYEYSPYPNATAAVGPNLGDQIFDTVIFVTGTTSVNGNVGPLPFEAEIVKHVEYIGNINDVTHTHSDLQAMSLIRNKLPVSSSTKTPHLQLRSMIDRIGKNIIKHSSPMLQEAVKLSPINRAFTTIKQNASSMFDGLKSAGEQGLLTWASNKAASIIAEALPSITTGTMEALAGTAPLLAGLA